MNRDLYVSKGVFELGGAAAYAKFDSVCLRDLLKLIQQVRRRRRC